MIQSSLYIASQTPPALRGQKCSRCGTVSFPPNPYGCEVCGGSADMLVEHLLAGVGRLRAFVKTHHANQRDLPVPYTVASIELDDGPVIRALMVEPIDDGISIGDRVRAKFCGGESDSDCKPTDLRFEPAERD